MIMDISKVLSVLKTSKEELIDNLLAAILQWQINPKNKDNFDLISNYCTLVQMKGFIEDDPSSALRLIDDMNAISNLLSDQSFKDDEEDPSLSDLDDYNGLD